MFPPVTPNPIGMSRARCAAFHAVCFGKTATRIRRGAGPGARSCARREGSRGYRTAVICFDQKQNPTVCETAGLLIQVPDYQSGLTPAGLGGRTMAAENIRARAESRKNNRHHTTQIPTRTVDTERASKLVRLLASDRDGEPAGDRAGINLGQRCQARSRLRRSALNTSRWVRYDKFRNASCFS